MNILVLTRFFPWPEVSGMGIRTANIIRALAGMGEVDVACLVMPGNVDNCELPDREPVSRLSLLPRPPSRVHGLGWLRWLAFDRLPATIAGRDYGPVRERLRCWARDEYDLVWIGRAESFVLADGVVRGPRLCDLDDLEDQKLETRLASGARDGPRYIDRVVARADRQRWRRLQRRIAASTSLALVCSEADRARLGTTNAAVLPNAYPAPARAVGQAEVREPPTVALVGLLSYGPNADAAAFFVDDVLPPLRELVPNVVVRLIGGHDARLSRLGYIPGVSLAGRVPDVTAELARADVAVVPVRFGGGTRVKILEAFAHRIPVVATSVGADGIGAVDGRHLLLADDAAGFAQACARLLTDEQLRMRLTDAAQHLWRERFSMDAYASRVQELAERAITASSNV